ncbi:hypothetical protein [Microbacterium paludicola]|uniref:hypothetical protein n=1 Tax=Microbacterium paludicola TaxID=300019 RepID=UPI0011A48086|nr:hypothetical protein [Microbacterium paludicola]
MKDAAPRTERPPSAREEAATTLAAVSAIALAPVTAAVAVGALFTHRISEGTVILMAGFVTLAFAVGWWVVAAMILLGIALHLGRAWSRWQTIWTTIAVAMFALTTISHLLLGGVLWPLMDFW